MPYTCYALKWRRFIKRYANNGFGPIPWKNDYQYYSYLNSLSGYYSIGIVKWIVIDTAVAVIAVVFNLKSRFEKKIIHHN